MKKNSLLQFCDDPDAGHGGRVHDQRGGGQRTELVSAASSDGTCPQPPAPAGAPRPASDLDRSSIHVVYVGSSSGAWMPSTIERPDRRGWRSAGIVSLTVEPVRRNGRLHEPVLL